MQPQSPTDVYTAHTPCDATASGLLRQQYASPQYPGCVVLPFFESGRHLSDEAFLADTQKQAELALPGEQYTVERQSDSRKAIVSSSKPSELLKAAAGQVPVVEWAQQRQGWLLCKLSNVTPDTVLVLRVDSTPHGLKTHPGAALSKDKPVAQSASFRIPVPERVYMVDAQTDRWRSEYVAVEHDMPIRYVPRLQVTYMQSWKCCCGMVHCALCIT